MFSNNSSLSFFFNVDFAQRPFVPQVGVAFCGLSGSGLMKRSTRCATGLTSLVVF